MGMPPARKSIRLPFRQLRASLALASALPAGVPAQDSLPPPAELGGAFYLDAWQIEKEFLVSPLALQQWCDLGITPDAKLSPRDRATLKPKISEFLATRCPVTIQDVPVEFTLDRIHFIEPKASEFSLIDPEATVSPQDIRISAVYAAPNSDLRQALQIFWDLIPENNPYVTVKIADAGGTRSFNLTKFNPSLNVRGRYRSDARRPPPPPPGLPSFESNAIRFPWLNVLLVMALLPLAITMFRTGQKHRVPVLLLLVAVSAAAIPKLIHVALQKREPQARISESESALILDPLLRGVYHSFHYSDRDKKYDELSRVIGGEALTPVFLEVQRTLESRERDGSRVRVNDLHVESSRPSPLPDRVGFETVCNWEVSGRVGHWGHFHDRTNLYRANFVIEPQSQTWKITQLRLHSREREPGLPPAQTPKPD